MGPSSKSSKSKKSSSSKSTLHHNPVTPEAATTVADPVGASASAPASIDALATQAIAAIDAIESMLKLDIVIAPTSRNQIGAMNRVSDTAIGLASDIVSAAPSRFPDFAGLPTAASYVKVIGLVASRASELAMHIQKSVVNQRAPAATKTLALYQVVKSLGRITENETMREKVAALKAEVAPKPHNPKPRVTKEQKYAREAAKATARRVTKARAVLALAEESVPVNASTNGSASASSSDANATPVAAVNANAKATPVAAASAAPVTSVISNGAAPAASNGVAYVNGAAAAS